MSGLSSVVNLSAYPLENPHGELYNKLVRDSRNQLVKDGVVTLSNFLTEEAINKSVAEIETSKHEAWHTDSTHNVFLDGGDESLPLDHVRNIELPTTVASLAYDKLDKEGPLLSLYHNYSFVLFVKQVLGLESLYHLADPLGAASMNIFQPGTAHNWHFDQSTFSVTLMIQKPEAGGLFRKTGPIRDGREEEDLYNIIENVIKNDNMEEEEGDENEVGARTLEFNPGTLSIFSGSTCLHEVTRVNGEKDRFVAVFCFSEDKGVKNSAKVQELFWGRVVD